MIHSKQVIVNHPLLCLLTQHGALELRIQRIGQSDKLQFSDATKVRIFEVSAIPRSL